MIRVSAHLLVSLRHVLMVAKTFSIVFGGMPVHRLARELGRQMIVGLSCCLLVACNSETSREQGTASANKGQSNSELLKRAAANMGKLESYELEMQIQHSSPQGATTDSDVEVGPLFRIPFTLTAKVQPESKGTIIELNTVHEQDIIQGGYLITQGDLYMTTDGGKTWQIPQVTSSAPYIMNDYVDLWRVGHSLLENDVMRGLVLVDGNPPEEEIDGTQTYKVTAELGAERRAIESKSDSFVDLYASSGTRTTSFWITTNDTPMILRMEMIGHTSPFGLEGNTGGQQQPSTTPTDAKSDDGYTAVSFRATWNWSRFNEDFGEVKPPPTETIKSP
jgi:hypothetical protein